MRGIKMSFKEKLKQNKIIRTIGKKINIHKEFSREEKVFSKNYMDVAESQKCYEYKMLLLVHSIEKGMTMATRPFGEKKIVDLKKLIILYNKKGYSLDTTAYALSTSIVEEWVVYYREKGWSSSIAQEIEQWYNAIPKGRTIGAGIKTLNKKELLPPDGFSYGDFVKTRRSVRNYAHIKLKDNDVLECINIALLAPTACNRQMVRIYRVSDDKKRQYIMQHIIGISGFEKEYAEIFIIAYDIASLNYYGERNQGYFNAGLVGMTFANALHSKGIGSCFLQWSNTMSETADVKKEMGISNDVCIAGILSAGYYADQSVIPMSTRKMISEVYGEL